ncbi:hypothetical protein KI387_000597, partial [Taxus chinensis]
LPLNAVVTTHYEMEFRASSIGLVYKLLLVLGYILPILAMPTFLTHKQVHRFSMKKINKFAVSNTDNSFETYNYTQVLDHFSYSPQAYQTFPQRYMMDRTNWGGAQNNSPIFVCLGAEEDITYELDMGIMTDQAPKFKALLVFIEHRYYGTSMPFGGIEAAYANSTTLGHFTSTQALADYATVIIALKKELNAQNCPVIVFGASYGGMLASWFRLKYPHVTIGALASSAPILYFDDITPSYGYGSVVTKDFKICEAINGLPEGVDTVSRIAAAVKYIQGPSCLDLNESDSTYPGWDWQICTEMVIPIGFPAEKTMFPASPFDIKEYARECYLKYGVLPRPHWATTEFGGHEIRRVLKDFGSNIIFSNGLRDPYSSGG